MNWYKRSCFCFNTLKNFTSKLFSKRINFNHNSSCYNKFKSHSVIGTCSISSKLGFRSGFNNKFDQCISTIFRVSRRSYNVDSNQVQHFKQQKGYKSWIQNHRKLLVILGFGSLYGVIYYNFSEVVPFTKRKQLLLPKELQRMIGNFVFDDEVKLSLFTESLKEKILPPLHPESVRLRYILKNVIKALHDQTAYDESSKVHLEGIKWEVLVVDKPTVNACCLPSGMIAVYAGLLKQFKSDDEVATVIGHEVGHVVARHSAEGTVRHLCFKLLYSVPVVNVMSCLLVHLPYSRKMEMEADFIGLRLTASAGYDPRIAPQVYSKLGSRESGMEDYISTHPCGKTRAQHLARSHVMDEALTLYHKAIVERRNQLFATVARLTQN